MNQILVSFLVFFTLLSNAKAAKSSALGGTAITGSELSELSLGIERSLYADLFLFSGYTEFSHPNMSDSVNGFYNGIGVTFGVKIGAGVFAGITADYRVMAQNTTVDSNHINLSSTRFVPLSPTVGYRYENYLVKLDYQMAGTLDVTKSLNDGSTLKLSNPSGVRLIFIFEKIFGLAPFGLYYEKVSFSEQSLSQSGVSQLNQKFDTWQFGGIINVLF